MVMTRERWNILMEPFFEESQRSFTLQELSDITKLPIMSIHRYLLELKREGLVLPDNSASLTEDFIFKKKIFMLEKIHASGLIDYLWEQFTPSAIILFGSMRKGEYRKESDIDIFIESSRRKELDLATFEAALGHPIQLFVRTEVKELPVHLCNNVLNGVILRGYVRIYDSTPGSPETIRR